MGIKFELKVGFDFINNGDFFKAYEILKTQYTDFESARKPFVDYTYTLELSDEESNLVITNGNYTPSKKDPIEKRFDFFKKWVTDNVINRTTLVNEDGETVLDTSINIFDEFVAGNLENLNITLLAMGYNPVEIIQLIQEKIDPTLGVQNGSLKWISFIESKKANSISSIVDPSTFLSEKSSIDPDGNKTSTVKYTDGKYRVLVWSKDETWSTDTLYYDDGSPVQQHWVDSKGNIRTEEFDVRGNSVSITFVNAFGVTIPRDYFNTYKGGNTKIARSFGSPTSPTTTTTTNDAINVLSDVNFKDLQAKGNTASFNMKNGPDCIGINGYRILTEIDLGKIQKALNFLNANKDGDTGDVSVEGNPFPGGKPVVVDPTKKPVRPGTDPEYDKCTQTLKEAYKAIQIKEDFELGVPIKIKTFQQLDEDNKPVGDPVPIEYGYYYIRDFTDNIVGRRLPANQLFMRQCKVFLGDKSVIVPKKLEYKDLVEINSQNGLAYKMKDDLGTLNLLRNSVSETKVFDYAKFEDFLNPDPKKNTRWLYPPSAHYNINTREDLKSFSFDKITGKVIKGTSGFPIPQSLLKVSATYGSFFGGPDFLEQVQTAKPSEILLVTIEPSPLEHHQTVLLRYNDYIQREFDTWINTNKAFLLSEFESKELTLIQGYNLCKAATALQNGIVRYNDGEPGWNSNGTKNTTETDESFATPYVINDTYINNFLASGAENIFTLSNFISLWNPGSDSYDLTDLYRSRKLFMITNVNKTQVYVVVTDQSVLPTRNWTNFQYVEGRITQRTFNILKNLNANGFDFHFLFSVNTSTNEVIFKGSYPELHYRLKLVDGFNPETHTFITLKKIAASNSRVYDNVLEEMNNGLVLSTSLARNVFPKPGLIADRVLSLAPYVNKLSGRYVAEDIKRVYLNVPSALPYQLKKEIDLNAPDIISPATTGRKFFYKENVDYALETGSDVLIQYENELRFDIIHDAPEVYTGEVVKDYIFNPWNTQVLGYRTGGEDTEVRDIGPFYESDDNNSLIIDEEIEDDIRKAPFFKRTTDLVGVVKRKLWTSHAYDRYYNDPYNGSERRYESSYGKPYGLHSSHNIFSQVNLWELLHFEYEVSHEVGKEIFMNSTTNHKTDFPIKYQCKIFSQYGNTWSIQNSMGVTPGYYDDFNEDNPAINLTETEGIKAFEWVNTVDSVLNAFRPYRMINSAKHQLFLQIRIATDASGAMVDVDSTTKEIDPITFYILIKYPEVIKYNEDEPIPRN